MRYTKNHIRCDLCEAGKEFDYKPSNTIPPSDWAELKFFFHDDGEVPSSKDLCPVCALKIGSLIEDLKRKQAR